MGQPPLSGFCMVVLVRTRVLLPCSHPPKPTKVEEEPISRFEFDLIALKRSNEQTKKKTAQDWQRGISDAPS